MAEKQNSHLLHSGIGLPIVLAVLCLLMWTMLAYFITSVFNSYTDVSENIAQQSNYQQAMVMSALLESGAQIPTTTLGGQNFTENGVVAMADKQGMLLFGGVRFEDGVRLTDFAAQMREDGNDELLVQKYLDVCSGGTAMESFRQRIIFMGEDSLQVITPMRGNEHRCAVSLFPMKTLSDYAAAMTFPLVIIGVAVTLTLIVLLMYALRLRREYHGAIEELKNIDMLTGQPNYTCFLREAHRLLTNNRQVPYAVIFTDIINYEYIRENYGDDMSDDVLIYFSAAIDKLMEHNEVFARVSNDRFAILMSYRNEDDIIKRYRLLYALLYHYEKLSTKDYHTRIKAGFYYVPEDRRGRSVQEMVDHAKVAQQVSNVTGKDTYAIYQDSMRSAYTQRAEIQSDIERALRDHEFLVYAQPKYDLVHNRIDSAEILVRWRHPTKGLIPPGQFIPVFEETGFVSELDRYMYLETCKIIREAVDSGKRIVPLSVNVSRVTAAEKDFYQYYIDTKKKHNVKDGFLELEFTESFAFENHELLCESIMKLKQNGIDSSIDDFGSGYSSFSALKEMPIDVIKLDRVFLDESKNVERDRILLSGVIQMAKAMGIRTVTEGIEKPQQMKLLKELGCDVIQGFLYAKPMPQEQFAVFLETAFDGLPIATLRDYFG